MPATMTTPATLTAPAVTAPATTSTAADIMAAVAANATIASPTPISPSTTLATDTSPADTTASTSSPAQDAEHAAMEALAAEALAALAEFETARDRIKEYVQRTNRPVTAQGETFDFAPAISYEFSLRQLIPLLRRHRVALADIATISKPNMDRLLAGPIGEKIRPLVADKVTQRFDHRKAGGSAQGRGTGRSRRNQGSVAVH